MESTAKSRVTPDGDELISEILIATPPERVFKALVDPALVVQWWGEPGIYRCTEFRSDLRVGGKWRCVGVDGANRTFKVSGEYLAVRPPRLLACTWVATWTGDVVTTVHWELEPTHEGALVRIRHSGFNAHPALAQNYRGWPRMLGWLQALVDHGKTVDDRDASPAR